MNTTPFRIGIVGRPHKGHLAGKEVQTETQLFVIEVIPLSADTPLRQQLKRACCHFVVRKDGGRKRVEVARLDLVGLHKKGRRLQVNETRRKKNGDGNLSAKQILGTLLKSLPSSGVSLKAWLGRVGR